MRKISAYFGVIAAAALTLVSCAKEANDPNYKEEIIKEGIPFEIVANPATKTTIDGLQTQWAANDNINLYHAVADSHTYVNDGEFIIAEEDLASGTFKGTLGGTPDSGTYDWYAFYPYVKQKTSPALISAGYTIIGSAVNGSQTQTGNNSTAHLAGKNYPLSGKASAVAFDATPSVQLSSLCTFVEVNVTNNSGAPLTVANVEFTAPVDIIGRFYIDISNPLSIDYIPTDPSYVSTTASLSVVGAVAIEDGASAKFYLGLKPFSTITGDEIEVSVNGYNKVITTTKDFTFQAGKIKTVNFDYDLAVPAQPSGKNGYYRVDHVSWLAAGDHVVIAAAEYDKAMSTTQNSNNRGVVGITKGTDGIYGTLTASDSVQEFVLETGTEDGTFAFKAVNGTTADQYIYAASSSANHLKSKDEKDANASFLIAISEGKATLTAQGSYSHNLLKYNNGSTLFSCYASGQSDVAIYKKYSLPALAPLTILVNGDNANKRIEVTWEDVPNATNYIVDCEGTIQNVEPGVEYAVFTGLEYGVEYTVYVTATAEGYAPSEAYDTVTLTDPSAKEISKLKDSIDDVPAAGVDAAIENGVYSLVNATNSDLSVTVDGTVVTDADAADGNVIYTVAANASVARSGWIKIAVAGGNTIQIDVNQLSGVVEPTLQYTLTPANGTNNSYTGNCDIDIDGITWNITGNSQMQPWRIGGKSLSGVDRALYSKTALNKDIRRIEITHGAASSITVNSMTVIVSKNADFSSPVSTLTPSFVANSTVTIDRPDGKDWSNCYYKIVYNVTVSGSSNKFVEFSKADFYGM